MNRLIILSLGALSLVAAGCTNPDRFGTGPLGGIGGNGIGTDLDNAQDATAADPASPAYFAQVVGDRVLFDVDQSTLSPRAIQILQGQASWLASNPDYTTVIEGHADEQGTREYNLALGERRANAVREFLVSQGVDGSRLRVVTYGKERPLELCSQEACYAKNRRAVTVVAAGLSG